MKYEYRLTGPGLHPLKIGQLHDTPEAAELYAVDWTAARAAYVESGAVDDRYIAHCYYSAIELVGVFNPA